MENSQRVNEKIQIKQLAKYNMFATKAINLGGKLPTLTWAIRDFNPRITVWFNLKKEENTYKYPFISAPMDPQTTFILLNKLQEVARGGDGVSYKIQNDTRFRNDDGTSGDKVLLSETYIGKNDKGICWISLKAPGSPDIIFEFNTSFYHRIIKEDGTSLDTKELSKLQTLATVDGLSRAFGYLCSGFKQAHYSSNAAIAEGKAKVTEVPVQKANDFDDDIPF